MEEIWKDIPNYENKYQASNLGKIRSVDRYSFIKNRWGSITKRKMKQRVLSPEISNSGYYYVSLGKDNKNFVHRLICLAFLGNPLDENLVVNHKNGNKLDNNINNLEWTTVKNNVIHSRLRLKSMGKKLNIIQIYYLIKLSGEGYSVIQLAEIFALHKKSVNRILNNKMWTNDEFPFLKEARDKFLRNLTNPAS